MNHKGKAIAVFTLSLIIFVIVPYAFVRLLSEYIRQSGGDPTKYFHNTGTYVLVMGTLLAIFASLGAYYEKGSRERLVFALFSALFLALWGYFFIGSMSIYYEGDTYAYEVLVPGIATVLMFSLSFRIIYRITEYIVYRKEYLETSSAFSQEQHGASEYEEPEENENELYF